MRRRRPARHRNRATAQGIEHRGPGILLFGKGLPMEEGSPSQSLEDRPLGELGCSLIGIGLAFLIALVVVLTAREPKLGPAAKSRFCRSNLTCLHILITARLKATGGSFPRFESGTDWVNWVSPEMVEDPRDVWCLLHCPEVWHLYDDSLSATAPKPSGPASAAASTDYVFNMALCGRAVGAAVQGEIMLYESTLRQHPSSRLGVTVGGHVVTCVDPARIIAGEPYCTGGPDRTRGQR